VNIPRHWARATEKVTAPHGAERALTAWGWSSESQPDAERHARKRLADLVARVRKGDPLVRDYAYGSRPPREQIGADPAFVQLCRAQRSFRARLTPKPWRCGLRAPSSEYPRQDADARREFEAWLAAYERACAERATCAFLEAVGPGRVLADHARVLRVHDTETRAESGLPLA
jgi:hypothetical protein